MILDPKSTIRQYSSGKTDYIYIYECCDCGSDVRYKRLLIDKETDGPRCFKCMQKRNKEKIYGYI